MCDSCGEGVHVIGSVVRAVWLMSVPSFLSTYQSCA